MQSNQCGSNTKSKSLLGRFFYFFVSGPRPGHFLHILKNNKKTFFLFFLDPPLSVVQNSVENNNNKKKMSVKKERREELKIKKTV